MVPVADDALGIGDDDNDDEEEEADDDDDDLIDDLSNTQTLSERVTPHYFMVISFMYPTKRSQGARTHGNGPSSKIGTTASDHHSRKSQVASTLGGWPL